MLDSITCTTLPPDIHQWYNDTIATIQQGTKCPRAVDMDVPDAFSDYIAFFAHWDEEILINGYAWSRILLQEGKKGEIHVSFSLQARTS
jgi:hypothetical protein